MEIYQILKLLNNFQITDMQIILIFPGSAGGQRSRGWETLRLLCGVVSLSLHRLDLAHNIDNCFL